MVDKTKTPNQKQVLNARQRRPLVAELYLQGKTQTDIAQALEISQGTVSRDLKIIQQEWRDSSIRDFDQAVANELARIDNLERTYWQAWFDSQKDALTKTIQNSDNGTTQTIKQVEQATGDKKHLEGVQWCIEQRIKLLGLAQPEKLTLTWVDALPEEYRNKPDEVQRQFAELLTAAARAATGDGAE